VDLLYLEVPCTRDAPSITRDAVDRLEEISHVREDARLIASELVTNAVLHSDCREDQMIEIRLTLSGSCLTIAVDDPFVAGAKAEIRTDRGHRLGGYGLRIVERVARAWGSEHNDGQLVWAELGLG
jgi:anti-sigma regulatory factor (Ser/Thr protein kinase)